MKILGEVWAWRASVEANQHELTTSTQIGGQQEKRGLRKAFWEFLLWFFEPCPYTWEGEIFHSSWNLEISFKILFYILEN
jgi:hypothetical protein